MKIIEYFRGKFTFDISDEAIQAACFDRAVTLLDENIGTVALSVRELIYADMLEFVYSSVVSAKHTTKVGDFSESYEVSGLSDNEKKALHKKAQSIYKKWNETDKLDGETNVINV